MIKILMWRNQSGICWKIGKEYGHGSCWATYLPKKRPWYYVIPMFKK